MKTAVLALAISAFLLVLPAAHASLQSWNIDISLNDDKTSDWVVSYHYSENVQKSDLFLLSGVTLFNVTADNQSVDCTASRGIGTSIVCSGINASDVVYNVRTFPIVSSLQDLRLFSSRISVTQLTDNFMLRIRLPLGTGLAEDSKLNGTGLNVAEPQGAQQTSDGRYIFVDWQFQKPALGNTYDFTVVYEPSVPQEPQQDLTPLFVTSVAVIAFLVVLVFFLRRTRIQDVLPVLTEPERRVMEIVLRDKTADQRKIVKETDFSKPKVSRIIHDLEKRGLIEKRLKGRTNIISFKKRHKTAISEADNKKVD